MSIADSIINSRADWTLRAFRPRFNMRLLRRIIAHLRKQEPLKREDLIELEQAIAAMKASAESTLAALQKADAR